MQPVKKSTRRAAVVAGAAGVALIGAVGIGAAAYAATPTPEASGSTATPSGAPTGGPGSGPGEHVHEPHIGGTVVTVSGTTVTVTDRDGFTRTIELGDGVTVTKDGASSSVSAITEGEHIEATGTVDANGTTLDATAVTVGQPTRPSGGPAGRGGPEGRGGHGGPGGLGGMRGPGGTDAPNSSDAPTDAPTDAPSSAPTGTPSAS